MPNLLQYDWSGCLLRGTGISREQFAELEPHLQAARGEVLDVDIPLFASGQSVPDEKVPLDAGFVELPSKIWEDYEKSNTESELGSILQAAKRLGSKVDKVVVLGIGGSYMGARAMMDACKHPYHNELSREARGGVPRMYFEGNNVDNDAAAGLLDLLGGNSNPPVNCDSVEDSWGIVVISKSGGTMETAACFRVFLNALSDHCGGDAEKIAERVIPVTGKSGKLFELATALGCPDIYAVPDGVGGRFSVLSPVGLVPAALLGLDTQQLLSGAVAMNEHFRSAPAGQNAVLDYVGVCHLLEDRCMVNLRVLCVWSKALESLGLWYDQLLAESLGKQERGATPLTVVNTRDLHSRAQQHQEGARDKLITNVVVNDTVRNRIEIPRIQHNQDQLDVVAGKTLVDVMSAAMAGANQAYRDDNRPTADIHMERLDEHSLGQLFQMLMLATVVEGRLIDINPYGQPGVEAYKKHMFKNLGLA